jgi:hypothetical protein
MLDGQATLSRVAFLLIFTISHASGAIRGKMQDKNPHATRERRSRAAKDMNPWHPGHICHTQSRMLHGGKTEAAVCKLSALSCDASEAAKPHRLVCAFPVSKGDTQKNITVQSYGQRILLHPQSHEDFGKGCNPEHYFTSLTVFVSRDHANLFHFLKVQALPMFLALRQFGLEWSPFNLVFLDVMDMGNEPLFLQDFKQLAGLEVKRAEQLTAAYCTNEAIIGIEPNTMFPMNWVSAHPTDLMGELQRDMTAFRVWVMSKFGIKAEQGMQRTKPCVVVPLRLGGMTTRRLENANELVVAILARGWDVIVQDFGGIPFEEQLLIISRASILLGVHGAAFALVPFLPLDAVSVELMPFGFRYAAISECFSA